MMAGPSKPPAVRIGFTFRFEDRPGNDHLHVVVSRTDRPDIVIVNLTTQRSRSDLSCVVRPGEHRFVVRNSVVAYGFAEVISSSVLHAKLASGDISPHDPMSDDLVRRIWDGADVSPHFPLCCRQILRDQGLV